MAHLSSKGPGDIVGPWCAAHFSLLSHRQVSARAGRVVKSASAVCATSFRCDGRRRTRRRESDHHEGLSDGAPHSNPDFPRTTPTQDVSSSLKASQIGSRTTELFFR